MPTKEDLLKTLTVKQLRQLAKENKIRLTYESWFWKDTASTKKQIVKVLAKSPKISKDMILSESKG